MEMVAKILRMVSATTVVKAIQTHQKVQTLNVPTILIMQTQKILLPMNLTLDATQMAFITHVIQASPTPQVHLHRVRIVLL